VDGLASSCRGQSARSEYSARSEHSTRSKHSACSEHSARSQHNARSEHSARSEYSARSEHSARSENSAYSEHSAQSLQNVPCLIVLCHMLGKEVWVGWPHLVEAKVREVSTVRSLYLEAARAADPPHDWNIQVL
jgi:hypothetical protein